jgi:hypothetical protein
MSMHQHNEVVGTDLGYCMLLAAEAVPLRRCDMVMAGAEQREVSSVAC